MRGAHVSSPLVLAKESMSTVGGAKEFQAIVENYPQLNSNEGFTKLLNELVETEDRITAMAKWYNYQAGLFNGVIESFPFSAAAAVFGLQRAAYLE
jgi:LemA protein